MTIRSIPNHLQETRQKPRSRVNTESVIALLDLLQESARHPDHFLKDEIFKQALKSQGSLAKWGNNEKGIFASSLNTIKRVSEHAIEGGFKTIDQARLLALQRMKDTEALEQRPNKTTKAGLITSISSIENELQNAMQDLWHITTAFNKAMVLWRKCADQTTNPTVIARCLREQNELRARLSLCRLSETSEK